MALSSTFTSLFSEMHCVLLFLHVDIALAISFNTQRFVVVFSGSVTSLCSTVNHACLKYHLHLVFSSDGRFAKEENNSIPFHSLSNSIRFDYPITTLHGTMSLCKYLKFSKFKHTMSFRRRGQTYYKTLINHE